MKQLYKIALKELRIGDYFRARPYKPEPVYFIHQIENGKYYIRSRVTALAWTTLEEVYIDKRMVDKVLARCESRGVLPPVIESGYPILDDNDDDSYMEQEYVPQPVSSDRYQGVYPSEEIERLVGDTIPTLIRAAYEAGYNQAVKDIEKDKEKSKKIPDESL